MTKFAPVLRQEKPPRKRDGIGPWLEYHKRLREGGPFRAPREFVRSRVEPMPDGTARVHLINSDLFAVIDQADIPLVSEYAWYVRRSSTTTYARLSGKFRGVDMHRILMPDTPEIDHRDGDGLNNRRLNLRACTHASNMKNKRKTSRQCSSRYKGVCFKAGRWVSSIAVNGKRIHLGRFKYEKAAANAYDRAAIQLHGEFAGLNFPTLTIPKIGIDKTPDEG